MVGDVIIETIQFSSQHLAMLPLAEIDHFVRARQQHRSQPASQALVAACNGVQWACWPAGQMNRITGIGLTQQQQQQQRNGVWATSNAHMQDCFMFQNVMYPLLCNCNWKLKVTAIGRPSQAMATTSGLLLIAMIGLSLALAHYISQ